jgi:hypothetical protein
MQSISACLLPGSILEYMSLVERNITMDLREIGWQCVEWIRLAQDWDQWWAVVNTVMNLRVI